MEHIELIAWTNTTAEVVGPDKALAHLAAKGTDPRILRHYNPSALSRLIFAKMLPRRSINYKPLELYREFKHYKKWDGTLEGTAR